ncbi:MAG: hypothetical protein ACOC31_01925 [Bacteroidota bacterium]
MEKVIISKDRVKDFLASRLTSNILQADESTLFEILRYEGIGGFEKLNDDELFGNLQDAIPEFNLMKLSGTDKRNLVLEVRERDQANEPDILIDIRRVIQTKF